MSNDLVSSEYGFNVEVKKNNDLSSVNENRAMHEVQSAYVIAKKFPRNQNESFSKIINSCKRPFLAEEAHYAFPKGGKLVEGPSIRLAEVLAQCWGNIDFGINELSKEKGVSIVEVYAIDLETNSRSRKIIHVPHVRSTKNGNVSLTDAREIYLEVANQAARRLRDCIFKIIPGDVIEAASEQCKKTLLSSDVPMQDRIRKMVMLFDEFGIKVEHLEKKLGHTLDATIPTEIVTLQGIFKSLRDGMAAREDFFDMGSPLTADKGIDQLIESKKPVTATSTENEYDVKEFKGKSVAKETLNEIKDKLNK